MNLNERVNFRFNESRENMKKIIVIGLLFFVSLLHAEQIAPTSNEVRSYMLPKDDLHIKGSYALINNGLDVFGIRSSSAGEVSSPGSIGDFSALSLSSGYGINDFASIFYTYKRSSFDYMGETLDNNAHDLFLKLGIYYNPHALFDSFSVDLGLTHNSGSDLTITGWPAGTQIDDLSDSGVYLRFITGSKIRSSLLDFYLTILYNSIDTTIDGTSYDRDEYGLNAGFHYTLELGNYLVETGYMYSRLFKRDISNGENSNHHLNLTLSKIFTKQLLFFIGIDYYINQLNGIIPYLYNEETKNGFDQRFGYMNFGFLYHFDTNFKTK